MKPPVKHGQGRGRVRWSPPDGEWLKDQYLLQDKSANKISEEIDASVNTVFKWLWTEGITTRSRSEARTGERNPYWDGGGGCDAHYSKKAKSVMLQAKVPKQCKRCKTVEGRIEIHHRDSDRSNNVLENLQWLCAFCHRYIHWSCGGVFIEKGEETCA